MEKQHIKGFKLSQTMFGVLLRHGATVRCMAGIPADARFLSAHNDYQSRSIVVVFEHPLFDEVEEGTEFPIVHASFEVIEDPSGKERGWVYEQLGGLEERRRLWP